MEYREYVKRKRIVEDEQGWNESSCLRLAEQFIEASAERRGRFVRYLERVAREENEASDDF